MSERTYQRRIGTENEVVSGLDELEQSLRIIVGTREGSVPGMPTYGSRIHDLIDEPVNALAPLVAVEIPRAVRVSDPRIEVSYARPMSADASGELTLEIAWHPAGSGASDIVSQISVRAL